MTNLLAVTTAATAMRVGRGVPSGLEGGGGPGGVVAGRVDRGGERVRGCIPLHPLPLRQQALAVAVI